MVFSCLFFLLSCNISSRYVSLFHLDGYTGPYHQGQTLYLCKNPGNQSRLDTLQQKTKPAWKSQHLCQKQKHPKGMIQVHKRRILEKVFHKDNRGYGGRKLE